MKYTFSLFARVVLGGVVLGLLALLPAVVPAARASTTPTLSLSAVNGDTVQIVVYGDANASVVFYYNVASSGGMQVTTLGSTNSSGYFSTTISASSYGITAGYSTYVIVDGVQSAMTIWPAPSGTPSLSITNVTIGLGQSLTVYSQSSAAAVYMENNSNASVALVAASSTKITITGAQTGSTYASICYVGTASNCATLYVAVQSASPLSFSQNNFSVSVGQSTTLTVSGGSGSYSINNNTNVSGATAVLSGSTITVTGVAAGTTNVAVCDTNGSCGTLYITIGSTSGSVYFSNSNPSISVGSTLTLTVYGGSGYYVTGNSNTSAVSQYISGSSLTLTGLAAGNSTITVCSSANGCGYTYVTVGSASSNQVAFGVTNPSIAAGSSISVSLSGGSNYYISSNTNTNIATASVSGSTLTLYGMSAGSDSVVVCPSSGSCNTLYVTVTGTTTATSGTTTVDASSAASILSTIQSMQTQLATLLTQIQSMTSALSTLASKVTGTTVTSGGTTTAASGTLYAFTEFLGVGSQGSDVTALQNYLLKKGYYTGAATGYFGSLTAAAVEKYQTALGITAAGYVGPSTRAALNAGE